MLKVMSSPQLTELEAFWIIDGGFGEFKQDQRFSQLCSLFANINRDTKKRPEPYTIDDFILRPKEVQEVDGKAVEKQIRRNMDMLAAMSVKKKRK